MLEKCPVDVKILYYITLLQLVKVRKITHGLSVWPIYYQVNEPVIINVRIWSCHLFIYSVNILHPIKITIRWGFFPRNIQDNILRKCEYSSNLLETNMTKCVQNMKQEAHVSHRSLNNRLVSLKLFLNMKILQKKIYIFMHKTIYEKMITFWTSYPKI